MSSFLKWKSPINLETVFAKSSISYPSVYKNKIYWLELLPKDQGRVVLMEQDVVGTKRCLTPDKFSLRTKVHEYGGNCYLVDDGKQFFINAFDQGIYSQPLDLSEKPKRVSPINASGTCMYADMLVITEKQVLIAVCEQTISGQENKTTVVAIDINNGTQSTLIEGADFYSSLQLNAKKNQLAWIQWNHPNMPWNDTELWIADIQNDDSKLHNQKPVLSEKGTCVCQPFFALNGSLFFATDYADAKEDWQNFWNLYNFKDGEVKRVTKGQYEFGAPHWVFGNNRLANFDDHHILAICSEQSEDKLLQINTESYEQHVIISGKAVIDQLAVSVEEKKAVMICATTTQANEITSWSENNLITVVTSNKVLDDANISTGQHISYPTTDDAIAHAYFYAPKNMSYKAQVNELPPLLVMVHGGPTSKTVNMLDIQKQFWTTNGFAVLDINHRGSTGYGRYYRDALLERWGEVDAQDIVKGVEYVSQQGWINKQQVCIRGKSAGGYAVLRALTEFPDTFRAGACYYGIGNLVTLAETTHKFEKHYTDILLGEDFINAEQVDENSAYFKRSPLNFMHKVKSAMILFQGLDDKVVPPEVSREVVKTLNKLGIEHEYIEYQQEGHGFRKLETNVDALNNELNFYRRILKT